MIFDDNFFDLTGIEKDSKEKKTENIESNGDSGLISKDESFGSGLWGNDSGVGTRIGKGPSTATWASEYGNPDFDYVIESDLVTPKVEAVASEKKRNVVVDDDFETLDL